MLRTLAGWLLSISALLGQAKAPAWRIDPYTKNDPEVMAKLGYVSYGPFEFGQRGREVVTTEAIDQHLSYAQILWVETAHFRIGSALDSWNVPLEPETKKKLRGELERLQKVLPKVNPKTTVLDRWLRLHLLAMRMEDTYAEFRDFTGAKEAEFPRSKKDVVLGRGRFMGYGPYLGMEQKYLVLVTAHTGTYLDYLTNYIGRTAAFGQRWHFKETGSLIYGVATELEDNRLKHDTALHCDLVFNVVNNLTAGFRHYSYDLPVWITEGLSHWFQRRVNPKWNSFSQNEGGMADLKPLWRWEPETRRLIAAGKGTPFSEMYTWRDVGQIKFQDHLLLWSRWDFLMSLGQDKFADFMLQIKGRVEPDTWLTDQKDLVGATREALLKTYNLTPLSLDDAWKAWVLKTYPED